jgi:RNA polymerase sigma-70 factor (ECF subfamily)
MHNGQEPNEISARALSGVQETSEAPGGHTQGDVQSRLETFNHYRPLLFSIAYRMLGSVADAEDAVQDTFIRWQQASLDNLESPRAFLVTIVSRLCINQLQSARAQREHYVGQWLPEPIMTEQPSTPLETMHIDESVSMAFLVMLERLTALERAVFLLREVFDYEYREIANILEQSETNCRQILHRARRHVGLERPRFSAEQPKHKGILQQFFAATESGDLSGLIKLLADDVVLHSDGGGKAPAVPNVVSGADRVARGAVGAFQKLIPKNLIRQLAEINGAPAMISYYPNGQPFSVVVLEVRDEKISTIFVITNPDKLSHLHARAHEA